MSLIKVALLKYRTSGDFLKWLFSICVIFLIVIDMSSNI